MNSALKLVFVALLLSAVGCGQKNASTSESFQPAAPFPARPVLTLDPSTTGEIKGTVALSGTPPVIGGIDMSAAPPCLKLNTTRIPPVVVAGPHGELANVVVYLKSGLGNYQFTQPGNTMVLDQKGCMYVPRVIALMTGPPFEVAER